ncbi:MAG: TIGR00288 family NYN domain-containing protein [Euryarchaeota archaeon]|nr:TIGR00288 family NYN domain-containing protein [Euryarchaeota archaeon]
MALKWKKITKVGRGISKSIGKMAKREKKDGKRIGLLIDGPNILRKEFGIDMENVSHILSDIGDIRIAKVILNQYASQGLIEAISNQGFEVVVVAGDTDVMMGLISMEVIYNETIDALALATRDADFLPIVNKAKEHGKETIIVGMDPGFSVALQNAADYVIKMGVGKDEEHKK